ncbi:hypothetical protein [Brasilonema sp. UFV-L1]|uniref:hypothetical protein n=1 Tax=Brasilonema sp. UFV-L1 TaxID=2234130 RepID=UPI00145F33EA|nr:hypothetical protein [Brasilonema sp. UFV-L1]NMG11602.1 hypothetical protein [Brasilonema sp. UFV-L1]
MISRNFEFYIEELILHGFAPKDRYRISEALQQELTRLLNEEGVPPSLVQGGEIPHLDGRVFEVVSRATPETIGVQIAQSIYGGLGQ